MAGHLGLTKTADRVLSSFHWPGAMADLRRYCASCDVCQRSATKGAKVKAPLKQPPLIDTPFRRVAIDLIGPIAPCSGRGHRYILTMVDYATRYPEAVALKRVETEVVAEGLVEVFSRVGVPSEVLSDRGTQFTSGVMKEVSRLLGVTQLHTTPYHPQGNGLVKRFNGTLKRMLKKLCEERPTDWDRYIPAALFAYREAPQESTGFSPFELLYGRTVRGPVSILKELWTKEQETEEVRTTYQYVVDLRNRLEETCRFAKESLQGARAKQKKYFDRRVKRLDLKEGDKVLLLLPTNHNKILMHWKGPFDIIEKVGHQDYRIDVNGRRKLFHANLLRKYTQREGQPAIVAAVVDGGEGDPEVEGEILTPEFHGEETYRDVSVYEGLCRAKQEEARQLLKQFSQSLTDEPRKPDEELVSYWLGEDLPPAPQESTFSFDLDFVYHLFPSSLSIPTTFCLPSLSSFFIPFSGLSIVDFLSTVAVASVVAIIGNAYLTKRWMSTWEYVGIPFPPCSTVLGNSLQIRKMIVSAQGVAPDPGKVEAIENMAAPFNVAELRRYLGMINYLGRYLADLSNTLSPLNNLLNKDVAWTWGPEQEKAFQDVKHLITTAPTLAYFDPERPTTVSADATNDIYDRIHIGRQPVLVVGEAAIAEEILENQSDAFGDRFMIHRINFCANNLAEYIEDIANVDNHAQLMTAYSYDTMAAMILGEELDYYKSADHEFFKVMKPIMENIQEDFCGVCVPSTSSLSTYCYS
ncbi:hypothetical protein ACOMHN_025115 [Nucella lapillus]